MELITLHKDDAAWPMRFAEAKAQLLEILGPHAADVHHVGSTAVADLLAKPIVDIAVEAHTFPPTQAVIAALANAGYLHHGESGVAGRHWFTKGQPRTINLHYCAVGSPVVLRQLQLRDALRRDAACRREYEAIKQANLKGRGIDDAEYALAKSDFIQRVIAAQGG